MMERQGEEGEKLEVRKRGHAESRGPGVDWFSSNILIFTLLLAPGENIWPLSLQS